MGVNNEGQWLHNQESVMSKTIAITGKGGVGKTTIAGLLVLRLIKRGRKPVLAVDADPNTCLDEALGVKVSASIGGVREEAREIAGKGMASGVSKQQLLEMKIAESLVETQDFDLIAMGRPEGPGCYCYANNVLKSAIAAITKEYPYVVIDNEAGLENLSRRIVQKVDLMIMVADPSARGVETARRLRVLALEMNVEYDKLALIINRCRKLEPPAKAIDLQREIGADHLVVMPENDELADIAENDGDLTVLGGDSLPARSLDPLLDDIY